MIGGGIAGVASNVESESIMVYNDRSNYSEWEFIFDPAKLRVPPNPLTGAIGTPASQMGSMPGQSPPGTPIGQPPANPSMPGQTPFGQPAGSARPELPSANRRHGAEPDCLSANLPAVSAQIRAAEAAYYANLSGVHWNTFDAAERSVFRRLETPEKIQRFLDDLAYNKEKGGPTCRSPRRVLRDRTAHCMEGALFGAAALRMIGHPPLLLDLGGGAR